MTMDRTMNFSADDMLFSANLQEFNQRVANICNLERGGKLSTAESFRMITRLWTDLARSRSQLGLAATQAT
jgi:hypothetical protein